MSRRIAILALASLASACSHAPPPAARPTVVLQGEPAPADPPSTTISPEELRRDLTVFASDSFRGRETGTPDAQRAAAFLARRAQVLGLEPAGDSLYMQRVPLLREVIARDSRLVVISDGQVKVLQLGADVAPVTSFGDGLPEPKRAADAAIVFAGYGATDATEAQEQARLDLEGKVVVVLHGAPPGTSAQLKKKLEGQEALSARLGHLLPQRPAAILILMTGGAEDFYRQTSPALLRGVIPAGGQEAASDDSRPLPMVLFGVARAGSPLLPAKWPNDQKPQALNRRFIGHVSLQYEPFTGYNVVAVVRGTDPQLSSSYLAYGAHYDHIGVMPPESRAGTDSIANGADDDGSGSVGLLAIARQMMRQRPRRSVLFVWHVAEEKGMLGSAYFTDHATVPIDSIVAQFNADMIGRNDPNTVSLVGPRAAPNYLSWRLGMIVDSVNRANPKPFMVDRAWDDPTNPDQIYQRSDHFNYAKKGIPIIFFTTGLHADYHKVSDEPSRIDYEKLARVARLMLDAGYAVANRPSRPISDILPRPVSTRDR